jgi:predicted PurR-regulated permease PerM
MEAINPTVIRLEKFKIPRSLAITIVYLIILAILSFSIAGIVPILVDQTSSLIKNFPDIIKNTKIYGLSAIDLSSQFKILEPIPGDIANFAISIFSNLVSAIVILVTTFYLLLEKKKFNKNNFNYFGEKVDGKILSAIDELEIKIGGWVNSQLLIMVLTGVFSYIVYMAVGLKYAVSLAIIAGILEIIPIVGSLIALIFAIIVSLTISPIVALIVFIAWFIFHQIEGNIIIPKILEKTLSVNPIITILLLLIGNSLAGISGAVLAVPAYITASIILKTIFKKYPKDIDKPDSV